MVSVTRAHRGEVCGVKWSSTGNALASGGNDNLVYIWDSFKMSSRHYTHRFNEHQAAVKALAWCPYSSDVLASGGGIDDGCLKIWNTQKGTCISTNETGAQVRFNITFAIFLSNDISVYRLITNFPHMHCIVVNEIGRFVDFNGTGITKRY